MKPVLESVSSSVNPTNVKRVDAPQLGSEEILYFKEITKACLGPNEDNRSKALQSLSRNAGLQKSMPQFSSFIVEGIKKCRRDNLASLFYLIKMVKSLAENQSLSLEGYVFDLIPVIGSCVVSNDIPVLSVEGDHWKLRNVASRLSGQMCQSYNTDSNNLTERVAQSFSLYLRTETVSLNSFYGGLVGIKELGPSLVKSWIIPNVKYLSAKIDNVNKSSTEIIKAERIRVLLIQTIEPVLKTLPDPPELGSLWPYLQHSAGDSSLRALGSASVSSSYSSLSSNSSPRRPLVDASANHSNIQPLPGPKLVESDGAVKVDSRSVSETRPIVASVVQNNNSPTIANMVDPGVQAELHVYGVKSWVTEVNIRSNFSDFGTILGVYLTKVGYCHVKYSTREEAAACKEALNGETVLGRTLKISWATTTKFNPHSVYYIFCERFQICYLFNIKEEGCGITNCPRKHCCLFCYELFRKEEPHRSKFECSSKKPSYMDFPPRDKRPQPPIEITTSQPDGDQLLVSSTSSEPRRKKFVFAKR